MTDWRTATGCDTSACVEVSMPGWRKASVSGNSGCVEVNLPGWRKAAASGNQADCVETAGCPDGDVHVRDTKDREQGPQLVFTATAWREFVDGVKAGEL